MTSSEESSATFNYWFLGGAQMAAGSVSMNFVVTNYGGPGAFGFELYQNTLGEVLTATGINDLTVIDRSSSHINNLEFSENGTRPDSKRKNFYRLGGRLPESFFAGGSCGSSGQINELKLSP
jgi:hypothetical protein